MTDSKAEFGVVDYIVFVATLAISLGIGLSSAFKKKDKSPEDFLLGGRNLSTIPVALSLLTTFISALNIIGYAGEIYAYGSQMFTVIIGGMFGIAFAMFLTVPVFYPLRMTSINEYIELRFKSAALRLCVLVVGVSQMLIIMGVVMYAPSLALAAVTPVNYATNIVVIGVVCTAYSTLGGIRAVVWTDVFQFVVMVLGLCIIIVVGTIQVGGISKLFSLARNGGRLEIFNMNPSIYERNTFLNTIIFGFFFHAAVYGISQLNVQRICTVPTIKEARKVMIWNIACKFFIHVLIYGAGIVTYAAYAGCDPITEGKIQIKEQIISYYITDKLGYISGLSGIFVATLTASTLSTFSSTVNSLVAVIWKDFMTKLKIFSSASPKVAILINKIMSCFLGAIFIAMAFITSKAQSMIQFVLTIGSLVTGAVFGIYLLGMCIPRSTAKGAWSGFIVSCVFMTWMYTGALMYRKPPKQLPLSTEFCINNVNASMSLDSDIEVEFDVDVITPNTSVGAYNSETSEYNFPLMYLYGISYTMYPMIAPLLCLIVGIVVSYVTGPLKPEEVELRLITPILRKYYAKRSQRSQTYDNVKLTAIDDAQKTTL